MPTFVRLPSEVLVEIASHLAPLDVALLSLTCHAIRRRIGQKNQRLWFSMLKTAGQNLGREPEGPLIFDPTRDYWGYVTGIFLGKEPYLRCGRCLRKVRIDSDSDYYSYFRLWRKGSRIGRLYCEGCVRELFDSIASIVEIFPELNIPPGFEILAKRLGSVADGLAVGPDEDSKAELVSFPTSPRAEPYIRKTVSRRLIEKQIGQVSKAKSQSSRFLANWMIKMRGIGESLDQPITFIVGEYTRSFKRFHPLIEPDMFHYCLWKFILEDFQSLGKGGSNSIPLPSETPNIVRGVGIYLETKASNPRRGETRRTLASMRAKEYLIGLFGAQDGCHFDFATILYPKFLVVHIAGWALCAVHWMSAFSDSYLYPGGLHSPWTGWICCYWCLKENPSNSTSYEVVSRMDLDLRPESIAVHMLQSHPEKLGKRPKDPIDEDWQDRSCDQLERGISSDPAVWDYPLEDIVKDYSSSFGYFGEIFEVDFSGLDI
ncbi:hypothetical protein TWF481_006118 [Arthrobotrys musiformis]|uniref:F-box domain-containing protein n=1 Tax=Arthrobotrys musiformis TaxID=47236 RepID=A0AAV9WGC1_9PEZI